MQAHEKIRMFREQKKWTQEEMAEKLHLSLSGYAKIEQGKSQPNVQRLQDIAEALGIQLFDLMPDSDNNMICLINEGSLKQGHNFYSGSQAVMMEVEQLRLKMEHLSSQLSYKDNLLEQQARELAMANELIAALKKQAD